MSDYKKKVGSEEKQEASKQSNADSMQEHLRTLLGKRRENILVESDSEIESDSDNELSPMAEEKKVEQKASSPSIQQHIEAVGSKESVQPVTLMPSSVEQDEVKEVIEKGKAKTLSNERKQSGGEQTLHSQQPAGRLTVEKPLRVEEDEESRGESKLVVNNRNSKDEVTFPVEQQTIQPEQRQTSSKVQKVVSSTSQLDKLIPIIDRELLKELTKNQLVKAFEKEFPAGKESTKLRALLSRPEVQTTFTQYPGNMDIFLKEIDTVDSRKKTQDILAKYDIKLNPPEVAQIYVEALMRNALKKKMKKLQNVIVKLRELNREEKASIAIMQKFFNKQSRLSEHINYFQFNWEKILLNFADKKDIKNKLKQLINIFLNEKCTVSANVAKVNSMIEPGTAKKVQQRMGLINQAVSLVQQSQSSVAAAEHKSTPMSSVDRLKKVKELFSLVEKRLEKSEELLNLLRERQESNITRDEFNQLTDAVDDFEAEVDLAPQESSRYEEYLRKTDKNLKEIDALEWMHRRVSQQQREVERVIKIDNLVGIMELIKNIVNVSESGRDIYIQEEIIECSDTKVLIAENKLNELMSAIGQASDISSDIKVKVISALRSACPQQVTAQFAVEKPLRAEEDKHSLDNLTLVDNRPSSQTDQQDVQIEHKETPRLTLREELLEKVDEILGGNNKGKVLKAILESSPILQINFIKDNKIDLSKLKLFIENLKASNDFNSIDSQFNALDVRLDPDTLRQLLNEIPHYRYYIIKPNAKNNRKADTADKNKKLILISQPSGKFYIDVKPQLRGLAPQITVLALGKYPERKRSLSVSSLDTSASKSKIDVYDYFRKLPLDTEKWPQFLNQDPMNIEFFTSMLRMLEDMKDIKHGNSHYPALFWEALDKDKKLEIISTISDCSQLTRILITLRPEWRAEFLNLIPLAKFSQIITQSQHLGAYVNKLLELNLDEFVTKIDPTLIKNTIQNFTELDVFEHIATEKRNIMANLFLREYFNERVDRAESLARSLSQLIKYGLLDQIHHAKDVLPKLFKHETDLFAALSVLGPLEKSYFMSLVSDDMLVQIAKMGVNADKMAKAFSLLPKFQLHKLLEVVGDDWLKTVLQNVTDFNNYVVLLESLPEDMRFRHIFNEKIQQVPISYDLINNIHSSQDLSRLLLLLNVTQKEAFLNQLKDNAIDFLNDLDFTDRVIKDNEVYVKLIQNIPFVSSKPNKELADLLLAAKPEERKQLFKQHAKPSIFKKLTHDDVALVNLLQSLPSEKWRKELINDLDIKHSHEQFHYVASFRKLKSMDKAISRLLQNDATDKRINHDLDGIKTQFYSGLKQSYLEQFEKSKKELDRKYGLTRIFSSTYSEKLNKLESERNSALQDAVNIEAADKLSNQTIFIFDIEKIFSDAKNSQERLTAINAIANILKKYGNIDNLQITLGKLTADEIKILSGAFAERMVVNDSRIMNLDIRSGDNGSLDMVSQFLITINSEIDNLRAEQAGQPSISSTGNRLAGKTVVSLSNIQLNILEQEIGNFINGNSPTSIETSVAAYKTIKDSLRTVVPSFDKETERMGDSLARLIKNNTRNPGLNLANETLAVPGVETDLLKSPASNAVSSQLTSPLSAALFSPTDLHTGNSREEVSNTASTDVSEDEGSPVKKPRKFSFDMTQTKTKLIDALLSVYDENVKGKQGKFDSLDQLDTFAELVRLFKNEGMLQGDRKKLESRLKSVTYLDITAIKQIPSDYVHNLVERLKAILKDNPYIESIKLPPIFTLSMIDSMRDACQGRKVLFSQMSNQALTPKKGSDNLLFNPKQDSHDKTQAGEQQSKVSKSNPNQNQ